MIGTAGSRPATTRRSVSSIASGGPAVRTWNAPARRLALRERQVERRPGVLAQHPVLHVGDDADDVVAFRPDRDRPADGALSGPVPPRHALVHDGRERRAADVAAVEDAAVARRDPQRVEVARRDAIEVDLHVLVGRRRVAVDGDRRARPAEVERQHAGIGGRAHAGHGRQPRQTIGDVLRDAIGVACGDDGSPVLRGRGARGSTSTTAR